MLGAEWAHASASLPTTDKSTTVGAAKHYRKTILPLKKGGKKVKDGKAAAEYRLCLLDIQAKKYGRAIKAGDWACIMMPEGACAQEAP